jgi:hypothetical protein
MYFAILWKNNEISRAELEILQPENVKNIKKWIILFNTKHPELIKNLWWIIKAWSVFTERDLQEILKDTKIIWIQEESIGKHLKKTIWVRRFKLVNINHTDREIKNKGKELINLDNGIFWVVEQYQNIQLYETIDFEKPGRSMSMGMMPAKLTHIMLNIWLAQIEDKSKITIYDPFAWSWTTWLLANYFWYNFLGSDLKINYLEDNIKRREKSKFFNKEKSFDIFQHDITKPLPKEVENKNILIVTEWRLGPIVTKETSKNQVVYYQNQVEKVYSNFLEQTKWMTAVFTIPYYTDQENFLEENLKKTAEKYWISLTSISEIYKREGQNVGRKIIITSPK